MSTHPLPTITPEMRELALAAAEKALARYDRGAFRRILAQLIGASPTPDNLARFAEANPHKWAQSVEIMAGLAGFHKDVTVNVRHWNVGEMSEAELMARARELGLDPATIDVTPTRVPEDASQFANPEREAVGQDSATAPPAPSVAGAPRPTKGPTIPDAAEDTTVPAKPGFSIPSFTAPRTP